MACAEGRLPWLARKALVAAACLAARAGGLHYDYVEIGVGNFDILAQSLKGTTARGLSVEPVKQFLDRLKWTPRRRKVHAAIGLTDGWADFYSVQQKYLEPHCGYANIEGENLCLPWWFVASSALHKPSVLVERHVGAEKAKEVLAVSKVRMLSYGTLLSRFNVTSLHFLKIDTEGLDVYIVRQVLDWGMRTGAWPDRLQFERNDVTDEDALARILPKLLSAYSCWDPLEDMDVHCTKLRDLGKGRVWERVVEDGAESWAMDLGQRVRVAAVALEVPARPAGWQIRLGHARAHGPAAACRAAAGRRVPQTAWLRRRGCAQLKHALGRGRRFGDRRGCIGRTGSALQCGWTAECERGNATFLGRLGAPVPERWEAPCDQGAEARHVVLRAPPGASPRAARALGPATAGGARRLAVGRRCYARRSKVSFDGFDPRCEARCRADRRCGFFALSNNLWCTTSDSCEELQPWEPSGAIFALWESPFESMPLLRARQSSTAREYNGSAWKAIDGRRSSSDYSEGSCAHTLSGPSPWWSAELASLGEVAAVRVMGRSDCCPEGLHRWQVRAGADRDPWKNPPCGLWQTGDSFPLGTALEVRCERSMPARFVGIVSVGPSALVLCEVEAYAWRGERSHRHGA